MIVIIRKNGPRFFAHWSPKYFKRQRKSIDSTGEVSNEALCCQCQPPLCTQNESKKWMSFEGNILAILYGTLFPFWFLSTFLTFVMAE